MSEASDSSANLNVYEEALNEETTLDLSSKNLDSVPDKRVNCTYLTVIYLQNNKLTLLPDDFFPSTPYLMYLDLRDNRLIDLPLTIKNHQSLTHLLLQNNCLTSLPNELGTVSNLKVLQINGNPLMYPPREVIANGVKKILQYLMNEMIINSQSQSDLSVASKDFTLEGESYNSVIHADELKKISIKFTEKDSCESIQEIPEFAYPKRKSVCPKLSQIRHRTVPKQWQSAKYPKAVKVPNIHEQEHRIEQNYLKQVALMKHKKVIAAREKAVQDMKNFDTLRSWRKSYRDRQLINSFGSPDYSPDTNTWPYDTSPDYMTFLTREDIEKDLPDKYRKSITRRSKPSVPRKGNNSVHLALKIKQLFENLEKIDLNREGLTPRTEQQVLLNEIHKITEIKKKLQELSVKNSSSV